MFGEKNEVEGMKIHKQNLRIKAPNTQKKKTKKNQPFTFLPKTSRNEKGKLQLPRK